MLDEAELGLKCPEGYGDAPGGRGLDEAELGLKCPGGYGAGTGEGTMLDEAELGLKCPGGYGDAPGGRGLDDDISTVRTALISSQGQAPLFASLPPQTQSLFQTLP